MEEKDKSFWGKSTEVRSVPDIDPEPPPPRGREPVVPVELTPDQIDDIDQRAEDEEALFGETHDVSVRVPTIETEDQTKIPVSYETAEEAVLAMFIDDDNWATTIIQSGLRDVHFQKRKNKVIFPLLINVKYSKKACNYDLVADALEKESMQSGQSALDFIGGLPELSNIMSALPPVVDMNVVQGYVDMVFEQYKLSKVKETARFINNMRRFDEDKLVDKLSGIQQVISDTVTKHGLVPLDVLAADAYARYQDRHDHPEKYVPIETGFYWLNKNRAISKRCVCVIGAKTSIGKSVVVSNILTRMFLNDYKVLLFTPELNKETYVDRLMCAESLVSIDDWKAGTISNDDNDRYGRTQAKILEKAQNLYIEDKGSQSVGFVINSVKKHMLSHPVDVVVIDYLQIMWYWGDNTKKAMSDIMAKLCAFAKDNNIAVIILSQLRRSEGPPTMNDLKESGDIENFADSVILLHREGTVKHSMRNTGWYRLEKNRQGPTTDDVALLFSEDHLRFTEKDIPQDGVNGHKSLIDGYDRYDTADEDMPTEQTVVAEVIKQQGKT